MKKENMKADAVRNSGGANVTKPVNNGCAGEIYKTSFAKLRVPVYFAAIVLVSIAAIACLVSEVSSMISPVTGSPIMFAGDPVNAVSYLVLLITEMANGWQEPVQMFFSIIITVAVFVSLAVSVAALVLGIRAVLPGKCKCAKHLPKIAILNIAVNAYAMAVISMTASISPLAVFAVRGYAPSALLIGAVIVASVLILYIKITDIWLSGKAKDKMVIFDLIMLGIKLALAVAVMSVISTTGLLTVATLTNADTEFFAYVFAALALLAAGAAADAVIYYSFKLADFDTAGKNERKKEFIFNFISAGLMFLVFGFGIAFGHVIEFQNTLAVNIMSNSVTTMILSCVGLGVLVAEKILRNNLYEKQCGITPELS